MNVERAFAEPVEAVQFVPERDAGDVVPVTFVPARGVEGETGCAGGGEEDYAVCDTKGVISRDLRLGRADYLRRTRASHSLCASVVLPMYFVLSTSKPLWNWTVW